MALPGGFFYVNSGLILRADSEAELAGVMAHEIAHVAARHGTKDATKGELAQFGQHPADHAGARRLGRLWALPGPELRHPSVVPAILAASTNPKPIILGLQYMYKSGYDPNAFITFFEKIEADEKKQPGTIPKLFSTHPPTPERVKSIQNEIGNVLPARDQYIVTTSEFDMVKARLRAHRESQQTPERQEDGDAQPCAREPKRPEPATRRLRRWQGDRANFGGVIPPTIPIGRLCISAADDSTE